MKGYKAFNPDFTCRGKQYEENTIFEEDNASICRSGMHFCTNPLDTLSYYNLLDNNCELNTFAEVEALDQSLTDDNKKYCTRKLKIGVKLGLKGFIEASFDFLWEKAKANEDKNVISSSEQCAQLVSSKDYAQLVSSKDYAQLVSNGQCVQLASSGNYTKLASSGNYTKLASSGNYTKLASSGNCTKLASSGDYARLTSNGDYDQLASSGDYAKLASNGRDVKLASSGLGTRLVSSGDFSQLSIEGAFSVGLNIGHYGKIKGVKGTWITLAEYGYDKELDEWICICVRSGKIDGEVLKENTWYMLDNGEFVEVKG